MLLARHSAQMRQGRSQIGSSRPSARLFGQSTHVSSFGTSSPGRSRLAARRARGPRERERSLLLASSPIELFLGGSFDAMSRLPRARERRRAGAIARRRVFWRQPE